jgi:prepilin-type N-terminal cleavage/methylation domain-containing protein
MKFNSRSGFSLVEVMVALTISTFILASAYATLISLAKGSESMINYTEMNSQARRALEIFGRDSRMADGVHTFKDTQFILRRKMWDRNDNRYETRFVEYVFEPSAESFSRIVYDSMIKNGKEVPDFSDIREERILVFWMKSLNFDYYKLVDTGTNNEAKTTLEVKHVRLKAQIQTNVLNLINTDDIISARFMMRNKNVSE